MGDRERDIGLRERLRGDSDLFAEAGEREREREGVRALRGGGDPLRLREALRPLLFVGLLLALSLPPLLPDLFLHTLQGLHRRNSVDKPLKYLSDVKFNHMS